MTLTADIAIIGGGIVGAACADALSQEGLRVAVLEAAHPGGGATAAGMGHIVVMDDSEPQFALTRYSRDLWDALVPELPREAEFERRGTLWVAADAAELDVVHGKAAYYHERGVRAEILDEAGLRAAEPNLRQGLAGGLLVPDDSVVYAPVVAQWLLDRAAARGSVVRTGARVTAVRKGRLTLADGEAVEAERVICANGTAAVELVPQLPMRPRKGHLAITDRYPGFVHHQLIELGYLTSAHGHSNESVAFNVQPRATGQLLIGSSRQYGVETSGVDRPLLQRMMARAVEYMPGLAALSVIRTWTGFRAATEDKLPLLGPMGELLLATGHEGLGITTSLGSAALLRDLLLGRPPSIALEPYLPSRLAEPANA
jgi:D-hydroxyproline dehydrogenase subunit beta